MFIAPILLAALFGLDNGPGYVPTSQYADREVAGWTVRVNRDLLEGEAAELGREALALLEAKLEEIARVVPEPAVVELRKVPIWLGVADGHAPCAEYHPNRNWLESHGYNSEKAKAVEIGNARRFLEWSEGQPAMVLHELAHAYHDRFLGFDHPEIRAAHRRALESKSYESVRRGEATERAYALTDPQEFFAEATEAYFDRNDFFPVDRAELEAHDPETAALVAKLWGAADSD